MDLLTDVDDIAWVDEVKCEAATSVALWRELPEKDQEKNKDK